MLDRNKINMLQAHKFSLMHVTTSLRNARMYILVYGHPSFGSLVRVKVTYKKNDFNSQWFPHYDIETLDSGYEVLDAAKKTFENKATTFINANQLYYYGRD